MLRNILLLRIVSEILDIHKFVRCPFIAISVLDPSPSVAHGWKLDLYIMWNSLAQTYRIHKSGAKGVKIDVIFIEYLFFWAGTQKSYLHFYTWISFQLMHYCISYYVPTSNAGQGFPMFAQLYDTRKCNMQLIYWKYKAIHVHNPTRSFTIPFLKIILFWNKICWS